jgi:hypothetical protein
MAIVITKKIRTILLIVLGVLVLGGGAFLFWRINQEDTVAPEDSDAAVICPDDCTQGGQTGGNYCVDDEWVTTMPDCVKPAPCKDGTGWKSCTPLPPGGDDPDCTCDCGTDKRPGVNGSCKWETVCVPTYGPCGCHGWGDPYDCDEYGSCGTLNGGNYPASRTSWPSGTFCERGTVSPASPSFPAPGKTTTWQCTGAGATVNCSAKRQSLPKFTVTYDGNGGSCTPASRTVEQGSASAPPTCTRDDYNLAGFTRTSGGSNSGNLNNETGRVGNVTADQTIEAQWSESCGDGTCAADEDANSCPVDCDAECGDNYCTHDENAATCPDDCDADCGDGYCTHDEDAGTCPEDCDADCGDGICSGDETPLSCPADCDSVCGDGMCTEGEDYDNCPADCEGGGGSTTVPQTGVLDTVLGRVSLGVSFIFLGGLVSQYSRINYLWNSITEKHEFRQEIKKQKRVAKRRKKLEDRFK